MYARISICLFLIAASHHLPRFAVLPRIAIRITSRIKPVNQLILTFTRLLLPIPVLQFRRLVIGTPVRLRHILTDSHTHFLHLILPKLIPDITHRILPLFFVGCLRHTVC